ncbi:MAG TPA: VPDSG-CTERM sorting domain-containing protein [Chthoniobacterales bacterium]
MKTSLRLPFVALLLALALIVSTGNKLHAGPVVQTLLIDVDEQGNGTFDIVGLGSGGLTYFVGQDPGPGGLSNALVYQFSGPLSVVVTAGDLFLMDPLGGTSDVIRFNPPNFAQAFSADGVAPANFSTLVFYSSPGGSELADTGFPTQNYTNQKTILEDEILGTTYTPGPGDPGSINGLLVVYKFLSGPNEGATGVPDAGSTVLLFGFGLIGMIGVQRAIRFTAARAR